MPTFAATASWIATYYRVKDWLHVLWLPVLGFVYNQGTNFLSLEFLSALLVCSSLLSYAYSFDRQYDIGMRRKNIKRVMAPSILPAMLAVGYSALIGIETLLLVLIAVSTVLVYVLPPLRLKGKPILVTLLNSLGFTTIFLIGHSISSAITLDVLLLSVFIATVLFPAQLVHEIAHSGKDRKMGLTTTPVRFGFRKTRLLVLSSLLVLDIWSIFLYAYNNYILIPASSIAFSFAFYSALKSTKDPSSIRMRVKRLSIILGLFLFFAFLSKI